MRQSKIERVIDKHGLNGLEEKLEEYWTRENDSYTLRSLADFFNKQILEAEMEKAGMHPLDGEVENIYRLLTDSAVSSGDKEQTERTLEQENIDTEQLIDDFVSHQTIHRYLRDTRGVSKDVGQENSNNKRRMKNRIDRLRGRTEAVVKDLLKTSTGTSKNPLDEFDVIVDIKIMNSNTGETLNIDNFFFEDES